MELNGSGTIWILKRPRASVNLYRSSAATGVRHYGCTATSQNGVLGSKLSARGFGPQTGNPLSGGDPERDVNRADWGILRSHLESRAVSTKNNLPKDTT